ncbi:hypothetical protein LIS82_27885 (plasmid) [Cytobacillus solani]|uniref:hypothetical protein n=1 Tax=Cytobacillus solani TaxID=1637975 RepID=UPI00207ADD57|nr:hypothetical protein [Cytobacillus solani]USK57796.1 hypothetical protein LIS82_27885 [Cytobacillus solani]
MTKTISTFINFSFAALMMVTALAYPFWSMTDWPKAYELVPSAATVYIEETKIPEEVTWTGNQVVAKLYRLSEENIPIEVNGRLFQYESEVKQFQSTVPLNALYKKQIELNETGNVAKIIFTLQ